MDTVFYPRPTAFARFLEMAGSKAFFARVTEASRIDQQAQDQIKRLHVVGFAMHSWPRPLAAERQAAHGQGLLNAGAWMLPQLFQLKQLDADLGQTVAQQGRMQSAIDQTAGISRIERCSLIWPSDQALRSRRARKR
jgi:hypothetical protein